MPIKTKPGTALRATAALFILNVPLGITVIAVYWLSGGTIAEWWVRGILAVAVAIAEAAIVLNTIAPPMLTWIKGEESVAEGQKASWEK